MRKLWVVPILLVSLCALNLTAEDKPLVDDPLVEEKPADDPLADEKPLIDEEPPVLENSWSLKAEIIEAGSETELCEVYGVTGVKVPGDMKKDDLPKTDDPLKDDEMKREKELNTEPGIDDDPTVKEQKLDKPLAEGRCHFISAVKVIEGHVGAVRLDGVKFALSGDLAKEFKEGEDGVLVITLDPAVTAEQKNALETLIANLYPVKWTKKIWATAPITWDLKEGEANVTVGDFGSLKLTVQKDETGNEIITKDVTYWNARSNEGFRMFKGEVRYKAEGFDFNYTDRAGFSSRIDAGGEVPKKD